MTSTPVSLNDESLNGSWIDINNAGQLHASARDGSQELFGPEYPRTDSVQNLGIISFQVERFLQEAQRNQLSNANITDPSRNLNYQSAAQDDNSGIYISDSETSFDDLGVNSGRSMLDSLKKSLNHNENNNNDIYSRLFDTTKADSFTPSLRMSKSGESLADIQLSDSLSLISRASAFGQNIKRVSDLDDLDWLWDWTDQPEYFSGQEWKVYTPKQDYLMRQRQLYCTNLNENPNGSIFSGQMLSLLFLTNILSIIIGAGITYSIIMRRTSL